MKDFKNKNDFKFWFDRYFSDEMAYVMSLSNKIIFTTDKAQEVLGIKNNTYLFDKSEFKQIEDEITKINNLLLNTKRDMMIVEALKFSIGTRVFCWKKKLVRIEGVLYIMVEETVNGAFSIKNLFYKQKHIVKNPSKFKVKFTQQHQCIMYLLANDFSVEMIAEILFISKGTVRTHIYINIINKLNTLGYEVNNIDSTIEILKRLGYGKQIPDKLMKRVQPISYIL